MKETPFLLWSHVLLVWGLANYAIRDPLGDDPGAKARKWRGIVIARAIAAGILISVIAPSSIPLALLTATGAIILPFTRAAIPARFWAELEVAMNVGFVVTSFLMVRNGNHALERAWLAVPASNHRIGAINIVVALTLLTLHGGTYIVRTWTSAPWLSTF